jgi:hypothetical protein
VASIVVSIPVSRPVRQYLSKLAPDAERPWRASMSTFLGTWLLSAMVRKSMPVREITPQQAAAAGYDCTWRFSVPSGRNVLLMPAARVREFNTMIHRFLSLELFHEIDEAYRSPNPFNLHTVIDQFRTQRGISDSDLSDELLRKQYHRFRTSGQELQRSTGQVVGPAIVGDNLFFRFKRSVNPRHQLYPMNDLISDHCDLPTGYFAFDFLPRHEIEGWNGSVPVPRYKWYGVAPVRDSLKARIGGERVAAGLPIHVAVSCMIMSDSQSIADQLSMMADMRFVLRLKNYKGKTRIVGTPQEFVQLVSRELEAPEVQGVGGWTISFTGDFVRQPTILT